VRRATNGALWSVGIAPRVTGPQRFKRFAEPELELAPSPVAACQGLQAPLEPAARLGRAFGSNARTASFSTTKRVRWWLTRPRSSPLNHGSGPTRPHPQWPALSGRPPIAGHPFATIATPSPGGGCPRPDDGPVPCRCNASLKPSGNDPSQMPPAPVLQGQDPPPPAARPNKTAAIAAQPLVPGPSPRRARAPRL